MGFIQFLRPIPATYTTAFLLKVVFAQDGKGQVSGPPFLDPAFKRIMVYVFIASRGGQNRTRIAEMLRAEPANLNRISERLNLDYKTVQHHIKVLEENEIVISSTKGTYGAVFFLTPYFEKHFDTVKELWVRFGQS